MFQASGASMSASARPATPLTCWPVLLRPQRSVKRVSLGVASSWTIAFGSA